MDRLLGAMTAEEKIRAAYETSVAETADALRELQRCLALGWDSARGCLPIRFPKLGGAANYPDPALSERSRPADACKKAMERAGDALPTILGRCCEMALTAPAMEALLELALDFDREYTATSAGQSAGLRGSGAHGGPAAH